MSAAAASGAPDAPRRHWTAAVYTRMNPVMRRLLRSRLHPVVSGRAALLGITGRRTGRSYEICVGYAPHGPDSIDVLVSDARHRSWWRNFVDGGPVRVTLRGEQHEGWAIAHGAPSAAFKAIADRAMPEIVGRRGAQRFFGVPDLDPVAGLTERDLARLEGFAVAVNVTWEPGGAASSPGQSPV